MSVYYVPPRPNRTGQTLPMDKKYVKAIEKRVQYDMDAVIEWWRRVSAGWTEIDGDTITFYHWRMDNAKSAYSRNVW